MKCAPLPRHLFASLRNRLLSLVLLAVLPFLFLVLLDVSRHRTNAYQEASERVTYLTRLTAARQDSLFKSTRDLLITLAQLPEVRSHDPALCNALLANLERRYAVYANLGAADLQGDVWCSALPSPTIVNVADRQWFQRVVQTRAPAVGDYQLGRITGVPSINLGAPILEDGNELQGVVFIAIALESKNLLVEDIELFPHTIFALLDDSGTILARLPDDAAWHGKTLPDAEIVQAILTQQEGHAQVRGVDGVERLYAFRALPNTDNTLFITYGISVQDAYAPADQIFWESLATLGLVSAFALSAVWFFSKALLLRPLDQLTRVTRAVTRGDLSARVNLQADGEIGELVQAIDTMAATLALRAEERARAERALERHARRLENLHSIDRAILAAQSLDELVAHALKNLRALVPCQHALLTLHHPEDDSVQVFKFDTELAIQHSPGQVVNSRTDALARFQHKPYLLYNDLSELAKTLPLISDYYARGVRSLLAIPLRVGDELLGSISLYATQPDAFTKEDGVIANDVAAQLAIAIQQTQLRDNLARYTQELEFASGALRESEARFRAIFEHAPVSIAITTNTGLLQTVNQAFCQYLGYPAQELEGVHFREFTYPDDITNNMQVFEQFVRGEIPGYEIEKRYIRRDGAVVWGQLHVTMLRAQNNLPELQLSIIQDITARKHAEQAIARQLEQLQTLHAIDTAIVNFADIESTINAVLGNIVRALRADAARVLRFQPALLQLTPLASFGFQAPALTLEPIRLGAGIAGRAALEGKPTAIVKLSELDARELARGEYFPDEHFETYRAVPLRSKGELRGALLLWHRDAYATDETWENFLEAVATQLSIALDDARLVQELQRSNLELTMAYDTTLEGWVHALDMRDHETEGHTRRVTDLTIKLARAYGIHESELVHLRRGALLHDIGKMAIPDAILLKPDRLTDDEWELMKQHPVYAYEWLKPIPFLRAALEIPYAHHERWDGSGYPRGLRGEQIPLAARLFAVADVWDALISDRPYRPAWTHAQARAYLQERAGIEFDPRLVALFLQVV